MFVQSLKNIGYYLGLRTESIHIVIAVTWAVECSSFTENKKQFRYRPYTWKPVNDAWRSYSIDSPDIQDDVGVLEAVYAKWRDTSQLHLPCAPQTSPFASASETPWGPGVLLIDYRKVDSINSNLWGEVFPKLFEQVVNNDFLCTSSKDWWVSREHYRGRAYITFLG